MELVGSTRIERLALEQPPLFRQLFEAHSGYVVNTLRRFGVREADLPDQLHEVFMAVHRRIHSGQYDATLAPRPYLAATAFRTASDYRRLASNRRELLVDAEPAPNGDVLPADALLEAAEERALVIAVLGAVPPERRAVLVMHDIDEHTMPDIARALEIPLNTAYSRLRLAREDFKKAHARVRARSARPGGGGADTRTRSAP